MFGVFAYKQPSENIDNEVASNKYLSGQLETNSTTQCLSFPVVQFPKNSFSLSENCKDSLNYWYKLLLNNPTLVIQIDGHSDQTEKYPLKLSQKRAETCKNYLASMGIDSARLAAKGWGVSKLLIKNEQIRNAKNQAVKDSLLQLNRRSEFEIVRFDYPEK